MEETVKAMKESKDKIDYQKASNKSINFTDPIKSIPKKSKKK